jgi:ABC-type microcin C transport system duplicated ATPase subunit YejF
MVEIPAVTCVWLRPLRSWNQSFLKSRSSAMPLVRYLSTSIAVMEHGRLAETGNAEALCATPREACTRQLLATTPEFPASAG